MFESLWIILDNGLCFYHVDFLLKDSSQVSQDLFSGFVSAMFSFSDELGGGGVETIRMKNKTIHYVKDKDGIITAAATKPRSNAKRVREALLAIGKLFREKFPEHLDIVLDDSDPRVLSLERDISALINQRQIAPRTPRGQKIETSLQSALAGQQSIEEVVEIVEEAFSKGLSGRDKKVIKRLFSDLSTLAEELEVKPEVAKRFEKLQEGLTDWLDKAKLFLESGW